MTIEEDTEIPIRDERKNQCCSTINHCAKMYHPTSISIVALISLTRIVCGNPVPSRTQHHTGSAGSFDLPLTWDGYGFLGNISLGSPPQPITCFVDWTWISQYVFTEKSCHGDESRLYECFAKEQTVFNLSQSSTFQDQSASYPSRTWNPNHVRCSETLSIATYAFESTAQDTCSTSDTCLQGETLTAISSIVLRLRRPYRRLCL